jgi:ribosomal protein L37AE/L43A
MIHCRPTRVEGCPVCGSEAYAETRFASGDWTRTCMGCGVAASGPAKVPLPTIPTRPTSTGEIAKLCP